MLTRIRDVRRARGLTLADVAQRCRPPTTAQTIGRLETGMRTVSVGWLARIAGALEVDASELVQLPARVDLPLAAVLGPDGPAAPPHAISVAPPAAEPADLALRVDAGQGDYRARDLVWLRRLAPPEYPSALHHDVLAPAPVGRFAFGRLVALDGARATLAPPAAGARAVTVADAPWLAVARLLVRQL